MVANGFVTLANHFYDTSASQQEHGYSWFSINLPTWISLDKGDDADSLSSEGEMRFKAELLNREDELLSQKLHIWPCSTENVCTYRKLRSCHFLWKTENKKVP